MSSGESTPCLSDRGRDDPVDFFNPRCRDVVRPRRDVWRGGGRGVNDRWSQTAPTDQALVATVWVAQAYIYKGVFSCIFSWKKKFPN